MWRGRGAGGGRCRRAEGVLVIGGLFCHTRSLLSYEQVSFSGCGSWRYSQYSRCVALRHRLLESGMYTAYDDDAAARERRREGERQARQRGMRVCRAVSMRKRCLQMMPPAPLPAPQRGECRRFHQRSCRRRRASAAQHPSALSSARTPEAVPTPPASLWPPPPRQPHPQTARGWGGSLRHPCPAPPPPRRYPVRRRLQR